MDILLLPDIWKVVSPFMFPKKKTNTFCTYRNTHSALYNLYTNLIFTDRIPQTDYYSLAYSLRINWKRLLTYLKVLTKHFVMKIYPETLDRDKFFHSISHRIHDTVLSESHQINYPNVHMYYLDKTHFFSKRINNNFATEFIQTCEDLKKIWPSIALKKLMLIGMFFCSIDEYKLLEAKLEFVDKEYDMSDIYAAISSSNLEIMRYIYDKLRTTIQDVRSTHSKEANKHFHRLKNHELPVMEWIYDHFDIPLDHEFFCCSSMSLDVCKWFYQKSLQDKNLLISSMIAGLSHCRNISLDVIKFFYDSSQLDCRDELRYYHQVGYNSLRIFMYMDKINKGNLIQQESFGYHEVAVYKYIITTRYNCYKMGNTPRSIKISFRPDSPHVFTTEHNKRTKLASLLKWYDDMFPLVSYHRDTFSWTSYYLEMLDFIVFWRLYDECISIIRRGVFSAYKKIRLYSDAILACINGATPHERCLDIRRNTLDFALHLIHKHYKMHVPLTLTDTVSYHLEHVYLTIDEIPDQETRTALLFLYRILGPDITSKRIYQMANDPEFILIE